jgi:cyanobactin biosynthesis protein (PatB/AcyB/McaB family)
MAHTPKQSPPVRRPELVEPHKSVDVIHGTHAQLYRIRMRLLHGANYNDPPALRAPSYAMVMRSG